MNLKNNNLPAPKSAGSKVKNDIILVAVLLALVALAALVLFLSRSAGDTVAVTVDGKPFGEYPLSEDRVVEIENGDGYNILVIKDGKAHVSEASCPDGICSDHRPIKHSGASIVCLPNKVVVSVEDGEEDNGGLDIVS
jgi:hypothetical protein